MLKLAMTKGNAAAANDEKEAEEKLDSKASIRDELAKIQISYCEVHLRLTKARDSLANILAAKRLELKVDEIAASKARFLFIYYFFNNTKKNDK